MVSKTVPLPRLSFALLKMGAFAFGGMGSTLALLRSELGAKRGWITDADVAEALAIVQTLPGSTGVQVVAFLGWKLGGWPGALITPFSFVVVPPLMMMHRNQTSNLTLNPVTRLNALSSLIATTC